MPEPAEKKTEPTFLGSLDATQKAFISVVTGTLVIIGVVKGCEPVSASQLKSVVEKQAATDKEQNDDLDLLFQTQVRLVTSFDDLKEEVRETRKDLRAMDQGRPLAALTPTPAPTPLPTPTPTPAVP